MRNVPPWAWGDWPGVSVAPGTPGVAVVPGPVGVPVVDGGVVPPGFVGVVVWLGVPVQATTMSANEARYDRLRRLRRLISFVSSCGTRPCLAGDRKSTRLNS